MAPEPTWKTLSPESLPPEPSDRGRTVLIDTLPGERHRAVHIPGARNACVYEVTFLEQVETLVPDRSTPVVLYGSRRETRDADMAAEKLVRAGYRDVAVLEGGIAGWAAAGRPLAGEDASAPADAGSPLAVPPGVYALDPEASRIEWSGRNANTTHFGTLGITKGEVRVADMGITGHADMDMARIRNASLEGDDLQPVLLAHLASDDFFFTDRFPTARFRIRKAEPVENPTLTSPNYRVEGDLTLRGVTADLAFDATVTPAEDGRLSIEAHFDIDRTRWGVIYGSSRFFDHLGMHMVFDLVSVQLRLLTL